MTSLAISAKARLRESRESKAIWELRFAQATESGILPSGVRPSDRDRAILACASQDEAAAPRRDCSSPAPVGTRCRADEAATRPTALGAPHANFSA